MSIRKVTSGIVTRRVFFKTMFLLISPAGDTSVLTKWPLSLGCQETKAEIFDLRQPGISMARFPDKIFFKNHFSGIIKQIRKHQRKRTRFKQMV